MLLFLGVFGLEVAKENIMAKCIYLIQGQADLVKQNFIELHNLKKDVISLTYDEKLEGSIFFPNSTWAEGRNKLLEIATQDGNDYEYYVFLDDDTTFIKGDYKKFEALLLQYKPLIASPITRKTSRISLSFLKYQGLTIHDEQVLAFHKKVVDDGIVLPLVTKFDQLHWWISCEIQERLIYKYYVGKFIQFNEVRVTNDETVRYKSTMKIDQNEIIRQTKEYFEIELKTNMTKTYCLDRKNMVLVGFLVLWRGFLFMVSKRPK